MQALGKIDLAVLSYQEAIKIKPNFAIAYRNLSSVKKFKINDSEIDEMISLIKKNDLSSKDLVNFNFALGKAKNDINDYEKAYTYFSEANRIYKNIIQYDIAKDNNLFKSIKILFNKPIPPLFDSNANKNLDSPKPIFILGMPRSGSTLIEQIISTHSQIYGAGELNILDRIIRDIDWSDSKNFQKILKVINNQYLSKLKEFNRSNKYITDKMPLNFRWIGFILLSMPQAKIIHTKRNAAATCWSIYKNFFVGRENNYAYNQLDINNFYKLYLNLMNFWKQQFPGQIYELDYEKITENIELESRRVLDYIGVKWEKQCINFHKTKRVVKTNSAQQVRQKLYTGSSAEWHNYKQYLQTLIQSLD
ncbi:uncharacterized protein METZ01_LOCUS209649 [marine metagenome]|uniref:Uncharacterized protein n=1 Tax=marine metagenome TaxID=408172 RepID=A0A382F295_9ZZZZ